MAATKGVNPNRVFTQEWYAWKCDNEGWHPYCFIAGCKSRMNRMKKIDDRKFNCTFCGNSADYSLKEERKQ